MIGLLYKPFNLLFGIIGGIIASKLFVKLWSVVANDPAPEPTERDASWKAVLPAAALQGAIFAGVRAATQRGGAKAFERGTGVWPGKKAASS